MRDHMNLSEKSTSYLKMLVLGFIVQSPSILAGMSTMYPTVAMPGMKLNADDASWFASIACLSAPIGSIFIGFIIDKLGRRLALLCSVLPAFAGWLLLWWNKDWTGIIIGQLLNGISSGGIGYPAQVYTGECIMINHIRLRNNFLTWLGIGYAFGMSFTLLLASFVTYRQISCFAATLAFVIFVAIYIFIPESPAWLYVKNRIGDAELSQKILRIDQPILRNETRIYQTYSLVQETDFVLTWSSIRSYAMKITRKDVYKPLLKMIGLFLMTTFCGGMAILSYMVDVLESNSGNFESSDIAESTNYTIYAVLILVANILTCFTVNTLKTIKILAISFTLVSIGNILLVYGITNHRYIAFVPVQTLAIWLIIFAFNFGLMNLPNSIIGEVFPIDAKGYGSVVCVIELFATALLLKAHPYMISVYGANLYYAYAFISLLGVFYVLMFMVETVGKTLGQINREFL